MKVNLLTRFRFLFPSLLLLSLLLPALVAAQVPLIQITTNGGVSYQSVIQVPYAPQTAGDLNLVVVGWNDISSTVDSVTDTAGNTYVLAAGTVSSPFPTGNAAPAGASQAIYYAKNIVGGPNTVIVTFNSYTTAQDIRILEYGTAGGGLDPLSPLDTSSGASATASPASSGIATTFSANDLIFGSGSTTGAFSSIVQSCGTGCKMFGEPEGTGGINQFGDIVEDALVTTAGPYQAAANFPDGVAVMQMVALRIAGQTIPSYPITVASINPATSPEAGGVALTITGTGFVQGATVVFNSVQGAATTSASAVNCIVASGTTINCLSPSFTTAGTTTVVVTNVDGSAAALPFTYTASTPFTTAGTGSIEENGGSTNGGSFVTITGSDFAAGATVRIGGVPAYKVQVVDSQTIQGLVPAGSAGTQTVQVTNPSGANGTVPGGYDYGPGAGINFVQANSATTAAATGPSVAFNLPQTAGDLNVVVAGWGDTVATVESVTDSAGNTYAIAAPAVQGTGLTQVIYYAKNINASNANTVTVKFSQSAMFPDIRIAEYSGLDTVNPLDASGGAFGTSGALDSGPVTLTSAGDLFVGAGDVAGVISAPGNGFATVIVSAYGNNIEHNFPNGAGTFDATATQDIDTGAWVMQGVGFRQPAGVVPGYTVSATPLSPASIAPGSSTTSTVTITPSGGFTNAVMLTCSGLPTGATCLFATNPVTPGASAATSALTINTTASTAAGTSTVTISGASGSVIETTTVSLVVGSATGPTFSVAAANPTTGSVAPGASTTSVITVNGSGGFAGTVNLTCSVAPQNSPAPVCSLPASVSLSATTTSATATLTVSTTAATAALRHSSSIFYAMLLPIGGITLLGVSFGSRRKKVLGLLLLFLMASGMLFLASCSSSGNSSGGGGGGQPGTPAGTYTVTVTATSGSTSVTTPFTLTVQ